MTLSKVDIRPGVSVLSVLRHLNYKPWFALAEFVDNAVQSYLSKRTELEAVHGPRFRLRVDIDLDSGATPRLAIKDNAGGISQSDYPRAFRPAAIPPDRSGLSEFGMGMKSASCWFAPRWHVRTSALGEKVERLVKFDIAHIVNDQIEELEITQRPAEATTHFTEVVLEDLHHALVGRTLGKVKEHLTDIYRVFVREGTLDLRFNNDALKYDEPRVLVAPYFRELDGPPRRWHKAIEFDLGDGMRVHGFAALRETANTARSGFALFRRGRLIQGSGDEGYRPEYIVGRSNSYRYQRLFGELHLEGFEISHTKDGFRWDENEEPFLQLLREHLDSDELPLLKHAEGYRVRANRSEMEAAAKTAVDNVAGTMQRTLPEVLPALAAEAPIATSETALQPVSPLAAREFTIRYQDRDWVIKIELNNDPAESQWLSLSNPPETSTTPQRVEMRLSLAHPFMVRFAQTDPEDVEAILRIAAALGVAEIVARRAGVPLAGTVRRNINELLREALAGP